MVVTVESYSVNIPAKKAVKTEKVYFNQHQCQLAQKHNIDNTKAAVCIRV